MFKIDTVTLFAFFGTFQGLIFAVIFWQKNRTISNKIFALLLLATSIRIVKNVFVHLRELNPELFSNYELWSILIYIGIAHQLAIGPLFYLYFRSKLNVRFTLRPVLFWHFLPYLMFMLISFFVRWSFWKNGGLWACYLSVLIYYLLSLSHFVRNSHQSDVGSQRWLRRLLLIGGILMIGYSPMLFRYVGYAGGGLLYTIALLTVGYIMISKNGTISFFRTKYGTSSLGPSQVVEIREKLKTLMRTEHPYLDVELTLKKLAESLGVQPHHLSRVINQEFNLNFADYVNSFRLEEAIRRLENPQFDHYKIAAIAYDCGFNSVPTFNTLFKRVHQVTPSSYRKQVRQTARNK